MAEWLRRVLSSAAGEPSTKRHVVVLAAISLCLVFGVLGLACAVWALRHGDLGSGAVAALLGLGGTVAGLAGVAYRKPDVGAAVPPAAGGAAQARTASEESASGSAKIEGGL